MLGQELRKARLAALLTQEALAFSSGVDRTYISELENDLKSPTIETLQRLCAAMGVKASQLLARAERTRDIRKRRSES